MRCLLLSFLLCVACFAEEKAACPWINLATVSGILGGPAEMTVANSDACEFVRRPSPLYTLQIRIGSRIAEAGKCSSPPTPQKAIGNEATACAEQGKEGQRGERISGRVRDQHFLVRISTNDRSATDALLLEKASQAAEQVVGNLF